MKTGTLFGVSVGPGDSELMTLKAVRVIESCPVVAACRTGKTNTLAFDIAKGAVDMAGKEVLFFDFEMHAQGEERTDNYRKAVRKLAGELDKGKDVAFLTLGDATVYSTWSYIEELALDAGYACETVPGVTSFCASAAKLHRGLARGGMPIHIIPGRYEDIEHALRLDGTKVFMKSGSALSDVKRVLEEQGVLERSAMVVNCGLAGERVLDCVEVVGDEGYLATILVAGRTREQSIGDAL